MIINSPEASRCFDVLHHFLHAIQRQPRLDVDHLEVVIHLHRVPCAPMPCASRLIIVLGHDPGWLVTGHVHHARFVQTADAPWSAKCRCACWVRANVCPMHPTVLSGCRRKVGQRPPTSACVCFVRGTAAPALLLVSQCNGTPPALLLRYIDERSGCSIRSSLDIIARSKAGHEIPQTRDQGGRLADLPPPAVHPASMLQHVRQRGPSRAK